MAEVRATTRGRLPRGIRIANTTLALTRWPNHTRFAPVPDALRIAAFLSQTPASVTLTLKMLYVEAVNLYNFLSAAWCLGWLRQTEKVAQAAVRPACL